MSEMFEIWEKPEAKELVMITGWRQWADAGSISSRLSEYLVEQTGATKIGELRPDGYYLFQIPGTHDLVRPVVQLKDGYRQSLEKRRNEFFYAGTEEKGLVIFLGDEPHLNVDQYAAAYFGAAQALGVKRIVGVAGVYGSMPYDLDRQVSCIYSLPHLKEELDGYSVRFSGYEGGASIGSYLLDQAEALDIEFMVFYAFAPAYDFSAQNAEAQGIRIENDYKAWYDVMVRINHMLGLGLDLSDLESMGLELIEWIDNKVDEFEQAMPQLGVRRFFEELRANFSEMSFVPLDDVWARELDDLFSEGDES